MIVYIEILIINIQTQIYKTRFIITILCTSTTNIIRFFRNATTSILFAVTIVVHGPALRCRDCEESKH